MATPSAAARGFGPMATQPDRVGRRARPRVSQLPEVAVAALGGVGIDLGGAQMLERWLDTSHLSSLDTSHLPGIVVAALSLFGCICQQPLTDSFVGVACDGA